MDKKFLLQDLIDLFAEREHLSSKEAELFVHSFFEITEEALFRDSFVKVTGFGTTKLVEVSERESVNINTGERFQISGHSKVTFTPDNHLRDLVNQPFAHLFTVPLFDSTTEEELNAVPEIELPQQNELEEETLSPDIDENKSNSADKSEPEGSTTLPPSPSLSTATDLFLGTPTTSAQVEATTLKPTNVGNENEINETKEESQQTDSEEIAVSNKDKHTLGTEEKLVAEPENTTWEAMKTTAQDETAEAIAVVNISAETISAPSDSTTETNNNTSDAEATTDEVESPIVQADSAHGVTNIQGSILVKTNNSTQRSAINWWMVACLILLTILLMILSYMAGYYRWFLPNAHREVEQHKVLVDNTLSKTPLKQIDQPQQAKEVVPSEQERSRPRQVAPPPVEEKKETPETASQQDLEKTAARFQQMPKGTHLIVGTLKTHKMQAGENLYHIAKNTYGDKRFASYIILHNNIQNPDLITMGQELKLPKLVQK